MADDILAEGSDRQLNRMVAITVVMLSVFLGLCHIKDENLVQAMQQAKADAIDTWGEYQATKTKMHISESEVSQLNLLGEMGHDGMVGSVRIEEVQAQIAKYRAEIPKLMAKARGFEASYDAMNYHDDQFDASDALVGIAVSVAAVSALAESWWALAAAWVFGALGVLMGAAGFLGWAIHPDFLARFLS